MQNKCLVFVAILAINLFNCTPGYTQEMESPIITGVDIAVTNTESGKVRGYIHNGIYNYKGIPYAEAKRFEAPQRPQPWEGVRSSLTYGPVSPLINPTTSVRDELEFVFDHDWGYPNEDCLRINVWTPGINDGKKRPVLFWIHGGGFTAGSSQELPSTDGENLAKKGDVVVVSINHRLNVLGFLDLSAYGEKYKTSANSSIYDMQSALKWVNTNIANFGGDPNNVTIFGQSGGGAKVNTLMAMPSAKGLFHKAINQSGSFRRSMTEIATTQEIASEVLKALDINAENIDQIQEIPYENLAAAGSKALKIVAEKLEKEGKAPGGFGLNWGPSVDGNLLPYQMYAEEAMTMSKDIPLMIGTVKNEFASMFMGTSGSTMEQVKEMINKKYGDKAEAYIAAVKKVYPNDSKPTDLIDVDFRFRPGAVYQANLKADVANGAPVFMYLFDWQSPVMGGKYKAMHCMELPFVFNSIEKSKNMTGGTKEAYALADKMSACWIAFAKNGNPNHAGIPNWPVYNKENTATFHFDNKCTVMPQMDKELFELVSGAK